jgi:hypothetical protein
MRVRIEVVDRDVEKACDVIEDITSDLIWKYPEAEANLTDLRKKNIVEFNVKK